MTFPASDARTAVADLRGEIHPRTWSGDAA